MNAFSFCVHMEPIKEKIRYLIYDNFKKNFVVDIRMQIQELLKYIIDFIRNLEFMFGIYTK